MYYAISFRQYNFLEYSRCNAWGILLVYLVLEASWRSPTLNKVSKIKIFLPRVGMDVKPSATDLSKEKLTPSDPYYLC
jgi:hypothetical protein